jgi:hypothetical protein
MKEDEFLYQAVTQILKNIKDIGNMLNIEEGFLFLES